MVQEISLSKVCCVNCDKTFDATRLLSVPVYTIQKIFLFQATFHFSLCKCKLFSPIQMSNYNQIDNQTSIDHFKCPWKSITFKTLISFLLKLKPSRHIFYPLSKWQIRIETIAQRLEFIKLQAKIMIKTQYQVSCVNFRAMKIDICSRVYEICLCLMRGGFKLCGG